jgi:hypothetical protein
MVPPPNGPYSKGEFRENGIRVLIARDGAITTWVEDPDSQRNLVRVHVVRGDGYQAFADDRYVELALAALRRIMVLDDLSDV